MKGLSVKERASIKSQLRQKTQVRCTKAFRTEARGSRRKTRGKRKGRRQCQGSVVFRQETPSLPGFTLWNIVTDRRHASNSDPD